MRTLFIIGAGRMTFLFIVLQSLTDLLVCFLFYEARFFLKKK
jgi:hypothetical protein